MKDNQKFANLVKELVKEYIRTREPLLESPVPTTAEILIENKINKVLTSKKD